MIFDTDVLIWATRGDLSAARVIGATAARALSIVSLMELVQGARSKVEIRTIRQFLVTLQFRVLSLSESIGTNAATLVEQYALTYGIQVADALIAATAIEVGEPLCTRNVKHFRPVRGLSLVVFQPSF
jgi:predicted nucleic acid-binding protein